MQASHFKHISSLCNKTYLSITRLNQKTMLIKITCISSSCVIDYYRLIAQMPVVLVPIHFDIDPVSRDPFCQRSVVIRPFITSDFMTGIPAQPAKDIPLEVSYNFLGFFFYRASRCQNYCSGWGENGKIAKLLVCFISRYS